MSRRLEWPLLLVLVPVLCNAVWLWPELLGMPSQADTAFHGLMIEQASAALADGRSPVDFWIPQLEFGFPQFLYYQHLPHLFVVAMHRVLGGSVELLSVFHGVRWLLLVAFPLTVYWSARQLDWSPREAAVAAAASSLISGDARFGFEYNSYIWRGFGLYTQLWAMHLSFFAVALLSRVLKTGNGYLSATLCLAALALSQLLYAYMIAVTAVLVLLVHGGPRAWAVRGVRLAMLGLVSLSLSAYMIIPFLTQQAYLSTFPVLPGASGGFSAISAGLFSSSILDHGRWPVLSVLFVLSLVVALPLALRHADVKARRALLGVVVWAVLCFGARSNGAGSLMLGMYGADVSFRFIGALELFAILLIGLGGGWLWQQVERLVHRMIVPNTSAMSWRAALPALPGAVVLLIILIPALRERRAFYASNARWIHQTQTALREDTDLHSVLTSLSALAGEGVYAGRAYAGRPNDFGGTMRVGPVLRVADVVKARSLPALVPPYQGLSLNTEMAWQFSDASAAQFDLFDVRYAIVPHDAQVPTFFTPFLQTNSYGVYRVATRGFTSWITAEDRRPARTQTRLLRENVAWLKSEAAEQRSFIRWDYPADGASVAAVTSPPSACVQRGQSTDAYVGRDSIVSDVRCDAAGVLLFKTSYHPNWRVTANGVPVHTFMVSPSFLAAEIPSGAQRVIAIYRVTPGKHALLGLGLFVLAVLVVARDRLDAPARWLERRVAAQDG